jgi:hypothetical protein
VLGISGNPPIFRRFAFQAVAANLLNSSAILLNLGALSDYKIDYSGDDASAG